jgi:CRP/FNR family nitrogen fixation transcriptional regulator
MAKPFPRRDRIDRRAHRRRLEDAMLALRMDTARSSTGAPAIRYGAGKELFGEGAKAPDVFRVVTGVVRTCRFLSDGRRQIYAFHHSGDIFGFETGGEHKLAAEAVCDCTVVSYRRKMVDALASHDEATATLLFSYALQSLAKAQEHALLLGRRSALGKIAAFLGEQADRSSDHLLVDLAMTRQDIADYLGLTLETVSRTFTALERKAIIALPTARRIRITDVPGLRKLGAEPS